MSHFKKSCLSFLMVVIFSGCVGSRLPFDVAGGGGVPLKAPPPGVFLSGKVEASAGGSLLLENLATRPTLVMFAHDQCLICGKETDALLATFRGQSGQNTFPKNLDIITILVGADREIALEWKGLRNVPWPVAFDEDATVFGAYCATKPPCSFLQVPEKGVIWSSTGELTPDQISQLIGGFQF